jgi:hypothetical protein
MNSSEPGKPFVEIVLRVTKGIKMPSVSNRPPAGIPDRCYREIHPGLLGWLSGNALKVNGGYK